MDERGFDDVQAHFETHQRLVAEALEALREGISHTAEILAAALDAGSKVVVFGNGGSAAQASHFTGELVGRYRAARRPLPALVLSSDPASVTCLGNDYGFDAVFERQVEAHARPGDFVLGLTTSGRSPNVVRGLARAQGQQARTVALTGADGLAGGQVDHLLAVPSRHTAHVQEIHLMILHAWCAHLDTYFAP